MKARVEEIRRRIEVAARRSGRPADSVSLVAVAKTKPVSAVREAVAAGVSIIGENYIQEAREKFDALPDHNISWHLVGSLQRNKAKYAVRMFDLIHSVDSYKLAKEISERAGKEGKVQKILVQVDLAEEDTKSGVQADQTVDRIREIAALPHVRIRGLMTMPPYFDDPETARPYFRSLRRLRDDIEAASISNVEMTNLSMGMTHDFETAIEEGATLVRIGTAIFGRRDR